MGAGVLRSAAAGALQGADVVADGEEAVLRLDRDDETRGLGVEVGERKVELHKAELEV